MLMSFLVPLSIAFAMFLLSILFREEIASVLCGSIALVSFVVAIVLASWQIQLFLLLLLVSVSRYSGIDNQRSPL